MIWLIMFGLGIIGIIGWFIAKLDIPYTALGGSIILLISLIAMLVIMVNQFILVFFNIDIIPFF